MQTKTLFTQNDYTPWRETKLEGKLLIREVNSFKEEFREAKYQLVLTTGGFGCSPDARGNAIFVTECHNDNHESYRMNRCDNQILGIATEDAISEWKAMYGEFNDDVLESLRKESN